MRRQGALAECATLAWVVGDYPPLREIASYVAKEALPPLHIQTHPHDSNSVRDYQDFLFDADGACHEIKRDESLEGCAMSTGVEVMTREGFLSVCVALPTVGDAHPLFRSRFYPLPAAGENADPQPVRVDSDFGEFGFGSGCGIVLSATSSAVAVAPEFGPVVHVFNIAPGLSLSPQARRTSHLFEEKKVKDLKWAADGERLVVALEAGSRTGLPAFDISIISRSEGQVLRTLWLDLHWGGVGVDSISLLHGGDCFVAVSNDEVTIRSVDDASLLSNFRTSGTAMYRQSWYGRETNVRACGSQSFLVARDLWMNIPSRQYEREKTEVSCTLFSTSLGSRELPSNPMVLDLHDDHILFGFDSSNNVLLAQELSCQHSRIKRMTDSLERSGQELSALAVLQSSPFSRPLWRHKIPDGHCLSSFHVSH